MLFIKLLKLKSRRRHRVAHRTAHRWEPCEICGIVKILRSQDVRHDEVVGETGDGTAVVSIAAFALSLARASFRTERRFGRHREGCRCTSSASRCVSLPRKRYKKGYC